MATALDDSGLTLLLAFAIQSTVEFVDGWLTPILNWDEDKEKGKWKKPVMKTLSVVLASIVYAFDPALFGAVGHQPLQALVAIFAMSAGTEGVNSVLKFMNYAKQSQKMNAAAKRGVAGAETMKAVAAV